MKTKTTTTPKVTFRPPSASRRLATYKKQLAEGQSTINFPAVEVNFCNRSEGLTISCSTHGFHTTKAARKWLRFHGYSIKNAEVRNRPEDPSIFPYRSSTTLINFITEL